jgi:O-antigen/teichoic acid export membrane protein
VNAATSAPPAGVAGAPAAAGESRDLRVLARGGTLGLVGVVVSAVLQFLLVVAVTRGLGAKGAGTFMEAIALFTIVANLAQMGANTGLVRGVSRTRALGRVEELRATLAIALWPVAAVSLAAGAAVFALASPLADVFFNGVHRDAAVTDLRLFAVVLPLAPATMVALSATRGFGTMVPYVVVQNIWLPALRLALVVVFVLAGLGGAAVALGWAAPAVLAFAAALLTLVRLLRRAERRAGGRAAAPRRPRSQLAREFWSFSAPRGLASMLGMTVTWMGILLVGALLSTRDAGVYGAASRLSIGGAYALQAVGMAIAPQISALMARDSRERVERVYRVATWWLMALCWPLYLALLTFAPFVMGMFGPEFVSGQWALVILSAAMLVNLATGNVTVVLLMSGKSLVNLANAVVSLILNVTLTLLLVPPLGVTGAALAWSASIVYVNVAPVVQVRLMLGLRPPFGSGYAVVALATALCYGALGLVVRLILGTSSATFALYCVLGTAAYVVLLRRFRDTLALSELRHALHVRGRGRRAQPSPAGA